MNRSKYGSMGLLFTSNGHNAGRCKVHLQVAFVALIALLAGCDDRPKQSGSSASAQLAQQVSALSKADQQRLVDQRAVVEKHLADDASREKYKTAAGKLGTIRACLATQVFKPTQTYELQCLGVVLGDAFVQELKMEWVVVEDQDGRDLAVRLPETTILLYPITMTSKRVEDGKTVDVFELFNGAATKVEEIKQAGR